MVGIVPIKNAVHLNHLQLHVAQLVVDRAGEVFDVHVVVVDVVDVHVDVMMVIVYTIYCVKNTQYRK